MKLRAKKWQYSCKPIGLMQNAFVDYQSMTYALTMVSVEELTAARFKFPRLLGMPTLMATWQDINNKWQAGFYPCPNAAYSVRLRYYPPMEEQ